MTLDQGQRAFADRAEPDHHNRTVDTGVNGPLGHYRASSANCALIALSPDPIQSDRGPVV
jgi:hypothetical protein